ncbi:prepilin peptidase [Patescibacteria group bacterium]|nr:prepilin peptidase [Patescibacteria group bacterium]
MEVLVFFIGASIGSFLNVLIDRLPKNESINGRSHCDFCGKKLTPFDLIPIFSFIFLGGKCRFCHKKLSWQYPGIEILTGLIFLVIFNLQFPVSSEFSIYNFQFLKLVSFWGIASSLIVIFFSDLKYQLISDWILLSLFMFSLPAVVLTKAGLINSIVSGLIVSLPIFLIYYISHERAMGLGDVYLAGIIGFLLGWKAGYLALYSAFITGAIFGLGLMIFKKKGMKTKIAFGPFIVLGTFLMMFWGERIIQIIKKIYGF